MRKSLLHLSLATALCAALCPLAQAAERVTLSNGFQMDCARHEAVGDQVRLFTTAGSDTNYMDVAATGIAKIETVPDPVAAIKPIPTVLSKSEIKAIPATFPNAKITTLTAEELHPMLLHAGAEHRIDEDLLASVIHAESNGHPTAVSRAGAQGLMQLMPATAADLGVTNSFVPAQNISGGAAYLDQLLTRYHDDVTLALAAYNAGPAAVDRFHGVPPFAETRAYVRRVILEFNRRKRTTLIATALP